jgi:Ino eighty subunit 1
LEEVKAAPKPRTNPVNLIFVLAQFAPKISETHFSSPRDFYDLVMRGTLSSASRARAFLWLVWWYLESDFTREDAEKNPFGPGQYGENEEGTGVLPLKVPTLDSLTEEQAALENLDTEEEQHFGEVKRKERIAILASEPSPAMTALKRARKEKGLTSGSGQGYRSEDEGSEAGWYGRPQGKQSPV